MRPRRKAPVFRPYRSNEMTQPSKTATTICSRHSSVQSVRGSCCSKRIHAVLFVAQQRLLTSDRRARRLIGLAVLLLLVIVWILLFLTARRVDHMLSYRVMARVFASQQAELKALGIVDIPATEIEYANEINTHAALREILIRRERRGEHLQLLAAHAGRCGRSPSSTSSSPNSSGNCLSSALPRYLLVPNIAGWSPMRPSDLLRYNLTSILFDDIEMKQVVNQAVVALNERFGNDHASSLRSLYYQFSQLDRLHLWALSALYLYGGVFMGSPSPRWETNVPAHFASMFDKTETYPTAAFYAYTLGTIKEPVKSSKGTIELLATATAGNTALAHLLRTLAIIADPSSVVAVIHAVALEKIPVTHEPDWFQIFLSSPVVDVSAKVKVAFPIFVLVLERIEKQVTTSTSARIQPHLEKKVDRTRTEKTRLQKVLHEKGGEPGWWCNRCLSWAMMGTFEKCVAMCPEKYKETICSPTRHDREVTDYDVIVPPNLTQIPKIVHQTWFDDITADRYPQLSRLQASWRSSGWDYRFYTDDDARDYIAKWYPQPFLESFDALLHGAYKVCVRDINGLRRLRIFLQADLFRYLVLLREGGVYADVDVMLETDLDNFILPGMSFFAPRDVPCEYAGEAFCLWNGIVGSTPGNPILVRAVERLVNLIQDRADVYDMEREVCLREGVNLPLWKIRAQPLLFLSGPCGLGLALNEALHRSSLERLPIGYVSANNRDETNDNGDAFVLVGDKYDLGQFRFSDSDRNIIIASTNLPQASSTARVPLRTTRADKSRQSRLGQHRPEHYSLSKKGAKVWGTSNVYIDDLTSDFAIRMNIRYSST